LIERTLSLSVDVDRAWHAWTEKIDLWWPPGHRRYRGSTLTLEGRVGGRLVERVSGGEEFTMGVVTGWEPTSRLTYDFYPGASPETPTAVEICFDAVDGGSVVRVRHRRGRLSEERWGKTNATFARSIEALFESLTEMLSRGG